VIQTLFLLQVVLTDKEQERKDTYDYESISWVFKKGSDPIDKAGIPMAVIDRVPFSIFAWIDP